MATVSALFLRTVASYTWSSAHGGCLLDSSGVAWQPHASGDPPNTDPWTLRAAGSTDTYTIDATTAASLAGGTVTGAPHAGEYVDASGVAHWLDVSGGAVRVAPDAPPPPPPP